MKMTLISIYAVLGSGLFVYLFLRHLRGWISEAGAEKDDIITQKIKMTKHDDGRHHVRFILLLISLLLFAFSIGQLLAN
jgi:hypothetical protein